MHFLKHCRHALSFPPFAALCICLFSLLLSAGCGTTAHLDPSAGSSTPTVSLNATPASIVPGSAAMLTVSASNAASTAVTGSDGTSYSMAGGSGTQTVHPAATTTYTATATGPGGTASAVATITVAATAAPVPAPTVSLAASPASIGAGGSSTLTAAAANSTQITVAGSDGTSYSLPAAGGALAVTPAATTVYTAAATGPGGKASASTTVTVTPNTAPSISFGANPASITASGSSTLTVTAVNSTQVVISGSDGTHFSLPAGGGTQAVSPSATTTYTAVATGPNGQASAITSVTVTPNPAPSLIIKASPSSITASSSSLITVTALNSAQVTLSGSDGTSYTLPTTGGTQAVSPASTTTYTAAASGPSGRASESVTIAVTPNPAPSVALSANPASINDGSSSTLSVTEANTTQLTITGSDGTSYTLQPGVTQQAVSPSSTTTYTAKAQGPGGQATSTATVTVSAAPAPSATIEPNPSSIVAGNSALLTVAATNATQVTITGDDGTSYTLPVNGGTQSVSPGKTTVYTVAVTGPGGHTTAATTVTVTGASGSVGAIDHVIFMLQENRSFDSYFGMLNPYREAHGWDKGTDGTPYTVDGIDDKLTTVSNQDDEGNSFPLFKFASTCVDDETSSWLESYGDVSRYDFSAQRNIAMDGFVHTAEGFAKFCSSAGNGGQCAGSFSDFTGQRAMGYYDQDFLNYYYYMASNFAISDRWFTPVSSKSTPNRIATFTGGTTQGLVFDPFKDDGLQGQLTTPTIFGKLQAAGVSWKIYYSVTQGGCKDEDDCSSANNANYPATDFSLFTDSYQYLHLPSPDETANKKCDGTTQFSSVVGDSSNSFCIDPSHIAPLAQYFKDLQNGQLPSFAFIEAGYGVNDEHPGSGQSILTGQAEVAQIVNGLMASPSWHDSVFFLAYDEAGGPYDHVPPVPAHSNDFTNPSLATAIPELSTANIAVNPDAYNPCLPPTAGSPTAHCDLSNGTVPAGSNPDPGANPADAPAMQGFAAQLGFRVPNLVISPFTRKHYVSHIPMDHTAILKFVENRFIPGSPSLTARDAAQPDLTNFFDFANTPWSAPPTPPVPYADPSSCQPANFAPSTSHP